LLVLIAIASLGFFHAAARTVWTYKYWANKANDFERALEKRNKEIVSLRTADHEHPREDKTIGVDQLRIDLGRVLANRGRIWTKCEKQRAATVPSGITEVALSTDEANAFSDKMLVYAFEEGDDQSPGKYLGEFRVKQMSDKEKKVVLASTTQLVASLSKNVADSKGPWILYELMPTDEHEAFDNAQEKWVPEEFLRDGQADANGKKVERPLRDYLAIFRACEMYRTLFADRWESARRDLGYLTVASQEANNQYALAEKEKTQVSIEKQRAIKELSAVNQHNAALQRMLEFNQTAVKEGIANNLKYSQKIAALQKEAADLIDRRTRSMAQYGPGAN